MNLLELKIYPDPHLRINARPLKRFTGDLADTIRAMAEIMYINRGMGLAATQVGLEIRLLTIDTGKGLKTFVNPEIVKRSGKKGKMEEGCLSLPDTKVNISRSEEIEVKAQDARGGVFQEKFNGLTARVIQHEIDHLNGKLLIDYLNPVARFMAAKKIKTWKKKSGKTLKHP